MFKDISSFAKEIENKFPSLCLIIEKEGKEGLTFALKQWHGTIRKFDLEKFVLDFHKEVNSLSLFSEPTLFLISEVEKFKEKEKKLLLHYLEHPNPGISLLLFSLAPILLKEIQQKKGAVLQIAEEKPWQKKQRLQLCLQEKARSCGVLFSSAAIDCLINYVGLEKEILDQEFEKLTTFAFRKKEITLEDVQILVGKQASPTLWDLGEAIFSKNLPLSFEKARGLMREDISLFSILSALRSQIRSLIQMSLAYEKGGSSLLTQEYPYLKGTILTKKMKEIKDNNIADLKRGLCSLFETELKAKSIHINPLLLLEETIAKLVIK